MISEDLARAAQKHAAALKKSDEAYAVQAIVDGAEQARKDLPELKIRIEEQIADSGVPSVYIDGSETNSERYTFGLRRLFNRRGSIYTGRFREDGFRKSYIEELQRLLGPPFIVYGQGLEVGRPPNEVDYPFVRVKWG